MALKDIAVQKDKNNNNTYHKLERPRHCQPCISTISTFIPVSSQFHINKIENLLEKTKKEIILEKKVDSFASKISKDKTSKKVLAALENRNAQEIANFTAKITGDLGLDTQPKSTSKSSSKNRPAPNPKPAAKKICLDSEAEQQEEEIQKNYMFYKDFFEHAKNWGLHNYSNPERRAFSTQLLASLPGYSDHKKCQMANVG